MTTKETLGMDLQIVVNSLKMEAPAEVVEEVT